MPNYTAHGRNVFHPAFFLTLDSRMFIISPTMQIPEDELEFQFARSGGPGGQNVNKVASKAILRWSLARNSTIPLEVKNRLRTLFRSRITVDDEIVIQAQASRDQDRNREDCLEKLRAFLVQAATLPRPRRPSKPTRGSKERRLEEKRKRAGVKHQRRNAHDD